MCKEKKMRLPKAQDDDGFIDTQTLGVLLGRYCGDIDTICLVERAQIFDVGWFKNTFCVCCILTTLQLLTRNRLCCGRYSYLPSEVRSHYHKVEHTFRSLIL